MAQINLRTGFFRLWLVLSALAIAVAAARVYSHWDEVYYEEFTFRLDAKGFSKVAGLDWEYDKCQVPGEPKKDFYFSRSNLFVICIEWGAGFKDITESALKELRLYTHSLPPELLEFIDEPVDQIQYSKESANTRHLVRLGQPVSALPPAKYPKDLCPPEELGEVQVDGRTYSYIPVLRGDNIVFCVDPRIIIEGAAEQARKSLTEKLGNSHTALTKTTFYLGAIGSWLLLPPLLFGIILGLLLWVLQGFSRSENVSAIMAADAEVIPAHSEHRIAWTIGVVIIGCLIAGLLKEFYGPGMPHLFPLLVSMFIVIRIWS